MTGAVSRFCFGDWRRVVATLGKDDEFSGQRFVVSVPARERRGVIAIQRLASSDGTQGRHCDSALGVERWSDLKLWVREKTHRYQFNRGWRQNEGIAASQCATSQSFEAAGVSFKPTRSTKSPDAGVEWGQIWFRQQR